MVEMAWWGKIGEDVSCGRYAAAVVCVSQYKVSNAEFSIVAMVERMLRMVRRLLGTVNRTESSPSMVAATGRYVVAPSRVLR